MADTPVIAQYVLQFTGIQYVAQSVCRTVSMSHSQYVAQYVTGDRLRSPLTVGFSLQAFSMSHSSMLHGMLGVTGSAVLSQYALQLAGNHCVAQSACRTVSMSHSQYVAQSVCCTVSMSHSQYVAQSVCRTVSMLHSQYVAQSVCRFVCYG